eukprot:932797-Rhodomonas_salina.1
MEEEEEDDVLLPAVSSFLGSFSDEVFKDMESCWPSDLVCCVCKLAIIDRDLFTCSNQKRYSEKEDQEEQQLIAEGTHKICGDCLGSIVAPKKRPICRVLWDGKTAWCHLTKAVKFLQKQKFICQVCNAIFNAEKMSTHLEDHDEQGEECRNKGKGCCQRDHPGKKRHLC